MKKLFVILLAFSGCTDPKAKIVERQKEIVIEKKLIDEKLNATKDSSMPSPAQLKEWDSLFAAANALDSEYNSLQKELIKLK